MLQPDRRISRQRYILETPITFRNLVEYIATKESHEPSTYIQKSLKLRNYRQLFEDTGRGKIIFSAAQRLTLTLDDILQHEKYSDIALSREDIATLLTPYVSRKGNSIGKFTEWLEQGCPTPLPDTHIESSQTSLEALSNQKTDTPARDI